MIKCYYVDGMCKNGCELGFIGDKCKIGVLKMFMNKLYFLFYFIEIFIF